MHFLLLATICAFLSFASAVPLVLPVKRDVWSPPITYPTNDTIWVAGGTYNVTWNTTNEPSQVTNPIGWVYLRHGVNGTSESVLTEGFPLTAGAVNVTIPENTQPDSDYIIILMGDSGNWSPLFTIAAPSSS